MASAAHELDEDGSCTTEIGRNVPKRIVANYQTPHTIALQNLQSNWSLQTSTGERWSLTTDASHLVHHVPKELSYACIEPVGALPGSLGLSSSLSVQKEIGLETNTCRNLTCKLQAMS
jgi:hypothetical protein